MEDTREDIIPSSLSRHHRQHTSLSSRHTRLLSRVGPSRLSSLLPLRRLRSTTLMTTFHSKRQRLWLRNCTNL